MQRINSTANPRLDIVPSVAHHGRWVIVLADQSPGIGGDKHGRYDTDIVAGSFDGADAAEVFIGRYHPAKEAAHPVEQWEDRRRADSDVAGMIREFDQRLPIAKGQ